MLTTLALTTSLLQAAPERRPVEFLELTPDTHVATSFLDLEGYGPYPCNGLILRCSNGALVVDPGCTDRDAAEILDWAGANVGTVRAVLATHHHSDRTGGLGEAHRRGIDSFGLDATRALAAATGAPVPLFGFQERLDLARFGIDGACFFPGRGHAPDNVVVHVARDALLFGGCLVRSRGTQRMGNVEDADLAAWPETIQELLDALPDLERVVPGHGAPGSAELLRHTLRLARSAAESAPGADDRWDGLPGEWRGPQGVLRIAVERDQRRVEIGADAFEVLLLGDESGARSLVALGPAPPGASRASRPLSVARLEWSAERLVLVVQHLRDGTPGAQEARSLELERVR